MPLVSMPEARGAADCAPQNSEGGRKAGVLGASWWGRVRDVCSLVMATEANQAWHWVLAVGSIERCGDEGARLAERRAT